MKDVCAPAAKAGVPCIARRPTVQGIEIVLPDQGLDLDAFLDSLGRALTGQALQRSRGNISAAARLLGINRTTLVERLRRWNQVELAPEAMGPWTPCS